MLKHVVWMLAGPVLCGTLVPLALSAETKPSEPQNKIRVICPAIEEWDLHEMINASPDQNCEPIQLVVLATAKLAEKPAQRRIMYDLDIEKVLYGGPVGKTLRSRRPTFTCRDLPDKSTDYNLSLARNGATTSTTMAETPMRTRPKRRWLRRGRIIMLSAGCIFVGKVISYDKNSGYTVEVAFAEGFHTQTGREG